MGYGHRHGGHHDHDCCGHGHHGRHDHDHGHRDDDNFDEKRVIDTIVDLVEERVQRLLDAYQQHGAQRREGDGDEKRVVDLVVRLVSEHVREIVAEELDRRLGRPEAPAAPPARGDEPR
jgi:hypothetical protein